MNPAARRHPAPAIASGFLFLFLYAPIAVVIVFSFNAARHGIRWEGFTFDWYRRLLDNDQALAAARTTLVLGVVSTLVSTTLGTLLAAGLRHWPARGQRLVQRALQIPVFIPDIVMAAAMLLFYSLVRERLGLLELGLGTMIIAHVTFQVPFVTLVVRARFAGLDPALEEAARDLGAGPWQTFRHVTLPLIAPGVLAAAMLAFTLSLDDFVVSFFTSGPGATTLPILIYASVKRGLSPEINALATLIIAASTCATLALILLQRPRRP